MKHVYIVIENWWESKINCINSVHVDSISAQAYIDEHCIPALCAKLKPMNGVPELDNSENGRKRYAEDAFEIQAFKVMGIV